MNTFARLCGVMTWLALALAPMVSFAEDPHLTKVVVERPGIGDLSSLLHVKKLSGSFRFDANATKVTLVCHFYKNGTKLDDAPQIKAVLQIQGGAGGHVRHSDCRRRLSATGRRAEESLPRDGRTGAGRHDAERQGG